MFFYDFRAYNPPKTAVQTKNTRFLFESGARHQSKKVYHTSENCLIRCSSESLQIKRVLSFSAIM